MDLVCLSLCILCLSLLGQVPCIVAEPTVGSTTQSTQAGFPMWAIAIIAIATSVVVTVVVILLIRKCAENLRQVHVDTRMTRRDVDSKIASDKALPLETPAKPDLEDKQKQGHPRRSSSVDSYPVDEIRISLPMPPVSTALFSDKFELSSEEAAELYRSYMHGVDDPGFVSVDIDQQERQPHHQKLQQKAATLRNTLRNSLRRQRSKKQTTSSTPPLNVCQLFQEVPSAPGVPKTTVKSTANAWTPQQQQQQQQQQQSLSNLSASSEAKLPPHMEADKGTASLIAGSKVSLDNTADSMRSRPRSALMEAATRRLDLTQKTECAAPAVGLKPNAHQDEAPNPMPGPMPSPSDHTDSRWSRPASRTSSVRSASSARSRTSVTPSSRQGRHSNSNAAAAASDLPGTQPGPHSPATSRRSSVLSSPASPAASPYPSLRGAPLLKRSASGRNSPPSASRQSSIRKHPSLRVKTQSNAQSSMLSGEHTRDTPAGSPQGTHHDRLDSPLPDHSQRRSTNSDILSTGTNSARSSLIQRSPPTSLTPRQQHLLSLSMRAKQQWHQRPTMPSGFMSSEQEDPVPTVSFSSSTVRTMIPEDEYASTTTTAATTASSTATDPRGSCNGRTNAIVSQPQRGLRESVRNAAPAATIPREVNSKHLNTVRGGRQQPRGSIPWMQGNKQDKTPAQRERDRYLQSLK